MPAQCGTPQQFLRCCLGVFKRFGVIEAVLPETMPNGFCMEMCIRDRVNSIREMFFEKGMNYADIARVTGHDVKTVKKYIYMENFNEPLPKPVRKRRSKLDRYKIEIDSWLEADKQERKKQRHTALRVFKRLNEKYGPGFDCSYRLVALYVAEMCIRDRNRHALNTSSTN